MPFGPVSRRTALQLIAGQAVATSVALAKPLGQKREPPNVVFVLADDVGYGDLACLGNPYIKTPNIDRLHESAVRFTDFHVSPTCAPTRAALMTGKYCDSVGVWHTVMGRSLLDTEATTLAECFKSSGYRTGLYGKWHLGDNYPCRPHDRGFDDAVVCGGGGIWQTPDYFGNDDRDGTYLHNGKFQKYPGFSTDIFFDLSMQFMKEAQDAGQPFFCHIPTTAAHEPTWALAKDTAPYLNVPNLANPGFYGMIANIDANIGKLVRFLEENGLRKNTIFIFATDNGGMDGVKVFNASMRGQKGSAFDGGHRVPLFIEWPVGGIGGGKDVNTLAKEIDIMPTLTKLCQLNHQGKEVDGKSLQPLIYENSGQQPKSWPDRTIIVDSQREEHMEKWRETAVMTQRWRLVNSSFMRSDSAAQDGFPTVSISNDNLSKLELYEIAKDPGQVKNIAQQHPEVVKALAEQYDAWWAKISPANNKYVRIVLGNERENPSSLDCMDWHTPDALKVWNQRQILTGPVANGFWTVDVCCPGMYRFELRRWPRELDIPINAAYQNPPNNKETTHGISIGAISGRIEIAGLHKTKLVEDGAKSLEFTLSLPKGPSELRTTFICSDQHERGAYFVYVEKLQGQ